MTFLDGRKGGDTRHDGNGYNGPEHGWHREEEQKPSQSVCFCVREAEAFADDQCRNLIDNLDGDYYPGPDPQPCRNLHNGYQPYCAASHKADICPAGQHGSALALGMQFPSQVTIQHIADAAQAIDYPESRTCRITKQQAYSPKESKGSYYVWYLLHFWVIRR